MTISAVIYGWLILFTSKSNYRLLQAADSLLHRLSKGLVDKREARELETSERGDDENYSFNSLPLPLIITFPKK